MTGEIPKEHQCPDCPIENPRLGYCWNCSDGPFPSASIKGE